LKKSLNISLIQQSRIGLVQLPCFASLPCYGALEIVSDRAY